MLPVMSTAPVSFGGIPTAALDFYEDLENDNSKSFWTAHKAVYDESVRAPMEALLDELGGGKLYRPYRDVRFSKDKTPYKTFAAARLERGGYVSFSADGLYVGHGHYEMEADALQRFRAAVAAERTGSAFERVVAKLERAGYELGGDQLKSAPRGYANDHPRIRLLRHKGIYAGRLLPAEPSLHTRSLLTKVNKVFTDLQPFVTWLEANAG